MSNLHKTRESEALYLIWSNKTLSRGDLSQILSLKPPTVSALVNSLIKSGRIEEAKFAESSGGRRAKLLEIVPHWGWIMGVEFSSVSLACAAADMKGELYNLTRSTNDSTLNKEKILQNITGAIRRQLSYIHRRDRNPIFRIGVAISGLVDETNGVSLSFPRVEDWKDVPLKEILEKEFDIPVVVENRITAITYAEHIFGNHRNIKDVLIFQLGAGLGMGIILGGQVRRGMKWSVGEFGHIAITENDSLCYCGKRGCLESLASDYALVAKAKEAIKNGISTRIPEFAGPGGEITAEAICLAAADGDRLAHGMIEKVGYYIATGIANLLNVLGPELIIFGGNMVETSDVLLDCIKRNLRVHTLEYIEKHVRISRTTFGSEGGIHGAITIGLHDFYTHPGE
jgi:predicted NBD/HSP70 family sugar kinase